MGGLALLIDIVFSRWECKAEDDILIGQPIIVRCEVKNQTEAYEDAH